jgi:hypothetical protein
MLKDLWKSKPKCGFPIQKFFHWNRVFNNSNPYRKLSSFDLRKANLSSMLHSRGKKRIPGSTRIHRDPLGSIGIYGIHWDPLGSMGSIGIHWDLWDPLGSIGIHRDPLGSIEIHRDPLTFIKINYVLKNLQEEKTLVRLVL